MTAGAGATHYADPVHGSEESDIADGHVDQSIPWVEERLPTRTL